MTTYRMHGITDDTDTCELCGKIDLRRVVMLAVLDADGNPEEIIYAGTTCAARALAKRGTRTSAARVRDAAGAAQRVMDSARRWADEFGALTKNQFLAANSAALMNMTNGDITAALARGAQLWEETVAEVAAVRAGRIGETRFAKLLPTL